MLTPDHLSPRSNQRQTGKGDTGAAHIANRCGEVRICHHGMGQAVGFRPVLQVVRRRRSVAVVLSNERNWKKSVFAIFRVERLDPRSLRVARASPKRRTDKHHELATEVMKPERVAELIG